MAQGRQEKGSSPLRARARAALKSFRNHRFRVSEKLSGYAHERAVFEELHGYPLDLKDPRTFNEKVCWRKTHDHNPVFPILVDKYAVRDYVREALGPARAEPYLIPLLFETRDPARIPFGDLPPEFVIKSNHGSQMNLIVRRESPLTPEAIVEFGRQWIARDYGRARHEWAYGEVPRRVLVEALISGPSGSPPNEYKLHMFDGECGLIQLHRSPSWYDGHTADTDPDRLPRINFFTPDWEEVHLPSELPAGPPAPRPEELEEVLDLARDLSRKLDYLRVDLYSTPEGLRVGELTVYPWGGRWKLPHAFDLELGSRWTLPGAARRG